MVCSPKLSGGRRNRSRGRKSRARRSMRRGNRSLLGKFNSFGNSAFQSARTVRGKIVGWGGR